MKIDIIIGTRPEAIKLAPVYKAMSSMPGLKPRVVFTGQHRELLTGIKAVFEWGDYIELDVMTKGQSLSHLSARLLEAFDAHFSWEKPDLVVVQGDTSSAFMGALAAFYQHIPVAHVEAGLRTDDLQAPFPEELNRRGIAQIATLHFAPTKLAFDRLEKEGHQGVHLTGNTVVDAVHGVMEKVGVEPDIKHSHLKKRLLVTAHRREALDGGLHEVARALRDLVSEHKELEVLLPLHFNPAVRQQLSKELSGVPGIELCEPMHYAEMVKAMSESWLLLTDSGGLQEEAPAFQLPVLILRDKTERTEAVEAGSALLCGTSYEVITREVKRLLDNQEAYQAMQQVPNPFGDGLASYRIAEIIFHHFDVRPQA